LLSAVNDGQVTSPVDVARSTRLPRTPFMSKSRGDIPVSSIGTAQTVTFASATAF